MVVARDNKIINRYSYYDKFTDFLLFVKVDENCNLKCSFCYQGDKRQARMETDEQFKNCFNNLDLAIKKYLEILKDERYEYSTLALCFFGGEPTLNPKAIIEVCEYLINNYSSEIRDKITLSFTSNGIIFDDSIKEALKKMKKVSKKDVSVLISSDNDKEVYDQNRKLVGSDRSGFEIVQKHIKEYKEFLNEVNGKDGNYVNIATVLATPEQLLNNPMYIQNKFKDIVRSGKLLYFFDENEKDYIEAGKKFLFKAYNYLIDNCNLDNKHKAINEIFNSCFQLNGKDTVISECHRICTIDANGNVNWCNKHKNFGGVDISQEIMKGYIFNRNVDNSHFECKKTHNRNGGLIKDSIRPKLWEMMVSKFDPNVPISKVNIYNTDYDLYNFIKYMVGSTQSKEKEIYIENPSDKIKKLCEELEIKISSIPITSDENNIFYIAENGDLFFDEMFKENKELIISNITEKHFMWFHTPSLLKSVNQFYSSKIK